MKIIHLTPQAMRMLHHSVQSTQCTVYHAHHLIMWNIGSTSTLMSWYPPSSKASSVLVWKTAPNSVWWTLQLHFCPTCSEAYLQIHRGPWEMWRGSLVEVGQSDAFIDMHVCSCSRYFVVELLSVLRTVRSYSLYFKSDNSTPLSIHTCS